MIILLTGSGKGKTTSAIGQAIRAIGWHKKVLMVQFIKSPKWETGEDKALGHYFKKNFELIKGGKGFVGILGDKLPRKVHRQAAKETWKIAQKKIFSQKYDLIILDEINLAVALHLLSSKEVLKILKKIPPNLDLILTGSGAPKEFIKISNIVTEFKNIKYQKRNEAKKGIEY